MSKAGKSKSIRFGTTTNSYAHRMTKTGSIVKMSLPTPSTRGRSSRNTHWNGVQQLPSGVVNYGHAYRWKGHVPGPTDSVTSAGLGEFDIQGRGFQEVQDLLASAGGAFTQMAQDAIAKGAVEGRRHATRIEEEIFDLGNRWVHAGYPGMSAPGGMWTSMSRFDPGLGGYRGVSSSGNALRLINFNFKAGHTYGSLGDLPGTVEARVTSQMANLFENDAVWRRHSPYWSSDGVSWGHYWKGSRRPGKHYFNRFYHAFDQGLLDGVKKAEKNFDERIQRTARRNARTAASASGKTVV